MTDNEKIELFKTELQTITDEKLRSFAEILLKNTDDWFYHEPASTSGKYHPKFSLGDGGLMRHTKCVVYFLNEFVRADIFGINEREADLLRVGAIAHDIRKHDKYGKYVKEHAQKAVEFIREEYKNHSDLFNGGDEVDYMCSAVASHMGIWGNPVPKTNAEKALHTADLCASRREIDMEFSDVEVPAPEVSIPVAVDVNTYVFEFGKYAGKTLSEVDAVDHGYLSWIAGKADFNHEECRKLVIEFLNPKQGVLVYE